MAALQNTRNIFLSSSTSRVEGASVDIDAGTVGSIAVYSGGTVPVPNSITLTAIPTLYNNNITVTFSAPPPGGVQATGTAVIVSTSVTAVTITNPGSGYVTAPTVTISLPQNLSIGTGATATATISGGAVTGVTIVNGGTGYSAVYYAWAYRYGDTGNWVSFGTTAKTATLTLDAAWLAAAGANIFAQFRVIAAQAGYNVSEKIISIPIIRNGTSNVSVNYTNDSMVVPVNPTTGVATWTASGGLLEVYEGTTLLTLDSNTQSTTTPATNGTYVLNITKVSGDTLTEPTITGAGGTSVTLSNWAGTLTGLTVYRIAAYVRTNTGATVVVSTDVYIKYSTDPVLYYIQTSGSVIMKDAVDIATSGTHTSITIQGKSVLGSTSTNYGWITVTPNGGTEAATGTDTASSPITLAPADGDGKSYYTIKMYNQATVAGATLLDNEVIYVQAARGATGSSGASAKTIDISGITNFTVNTGDAIVPATATLTAVTQNILNPTYAWTVTNATSPSNTNSTITITPASPQTTTITVNLTVTEPSTSQTFTKSVTMSVAQRGTTGQAGQNGVMSAFPSIYQWTGSSSAPSTASLASTTYTWSTGAYTAPSGWSTTRPTNTTAGQYLWEITIPLTVSATTTTSSLAWAGLTPRAVAYNGANGTNGTSPVIVDLTNDNTTVATNSNGSGGTYTSATTSFDIFSGTSSVLSSVTALTITPSTGVTFSYTKNGGAAVTGNTSAQSVSVSPTAITSLSLEVTAIATAQDNGTLTIAATYGGTVYTAVFTVTKAKAGTSATVYEIEANSRISFETNGSTFSPASVIFSAFSVTGTSARTAYLNANGTIRLESSPDGTTWTTIGSDLTLSASVSTRTLTTSSLASTVRFVRATLLVSGTTVDQETIAITVSGNNGSATFLISRPNAVIGTSTVSAPDPGEMTNSSIGPGRAAKAGDIATVTAGGNSTVYKYTTSWAQQTAYITGSLIVQNTITASNISTNTITVDRLASGNTTVSGNSGTFAIGDTSSVTGFTATIAAKQTGTNWGIIALQDNTTAATSAIVGASRSTSSGAGGVFINAATADYGSLRTLSAVGSNGNAIFGRYLRDHGTAGNNSTTPVNECSFANATVVGDFRWYGSTGTSITRRTYICNATYALEIVTGDSLLLNTQISSLGVGTAASGTAGEIRATNNITAYYSDERLKTKLGKIENPLDKVMSLSGFYHEANALAQSLGYKPIREVGVSAQEVQRILPEAVAPAPIDSRYLTVRYERLVPLLIEAIKELNQKLEALKESVDDNTSRNNKSK